VQQWRIKDEKYRHPEKVVKKCCNKDKRCWLEEKSKDAKTPADKNDSKTL